MADMRRDDEPITGPTTVVAAEGARVGLTSCKLCGASVLIDPREDFDAVALHRQWHDDPTQTPEV